VYEPARSLFSVKEYVPSPLSVTGETVTSSDEELRSDRGVIVHFDESSPTRGFEFILIIVIFPNIGVPTNTEAPGPESPKSST